MKFPDELFLKALEATLELKKEIPDSDPFTAMAVYLKIKPGKKNQGAPKLNNQPKPKTKIKRVAAFLALFSENCFLALKKEKLSRNKLIARVIHKYRTEELEFSRTYLQDVLKQENLADDAANFVLAYIEAHPKLKKRPICFSSASTAKSLIQLLSKN